MSQTATTLAATAATVAAVHTVIGVDHYLPFVALGKASGWSLRRTLFWTTICGLGHVLSSVALAAIAGAVGWAVGNIKAVDAIRGDAAAYLLLAFGLAYAAWGLWRRGHGHAHDHGVDTSAATDDAEGSDASSEGDPAAKRRRITLWALFVIFVLGPCEPLIPLMVAPALAHNLGAAFAVVGLFAVITLAVMLVMVTIGMLGLKLLSLSALERWAHPLAGAAIAISGGLILLGL
jgi:sulfite exporter TauE/SafE